MENEELEKQEPSVEPVETEKENEIESVEEVDEGRNEPLDNKIEKPKAVVYTYEDEHLEKIESNRLVFLKFYKKQRTVKWIVGMLALAFAILVWLLVPNLAKQEDGTAASWAMPVMIVGMALALCIVFTYSVIIKRIVNKKMKAYFDDYYEENGKYVFGDDVFSEVSVLKPGKIERVQFDENGIYANVAEIGSRGSTEFKYNDNLMMVCECAAQVRNNKSIIPVFVGKYLVGPASYEENEPIIVYLKGKEGDKRPLPPTNIEDKELVLDNKHMSVWSNNKKWAKTINSKVIDLLKQVEIGGELIDVALSVNNGKFYVCFGFDDPLLVLPLEKQFNPNPTIEYKKDLLAVLEVTKELSK